MRVPPLGISKDEPAVVVLGAGASRGASFVNRQGVLPPLDADFFEQAQRMPHDRLTKRDRELFQFIKDEFGLTEFPTLETFFTQIEAVDRFHHDFNIQGRVSSKFRTHLTTLRRLIPKVFDEAIGQRGCQWHARLASALRANDTVLSFNYDCLIDAALRDEAVKRWKADTGYGFDIVAGAADWDGPPGVGAPYKNPIQLLKPHGSLNWVLQEGGGTVGLTDPYTQETQDSIVPPTWTKGEVADRPWNDVWRAARRALGLARLMILIGYSVPLTDQLSQALLRADVNSLRSLVIVNPDPAARSRVRGLLSSALSSTTTVIELSTFEEFASHLPRADSEVSPLDLDSEVRTLMMETAALKSAHAGVADQVEDHEDRLIDAEDAVSEVGAPDSDLAEHLAAVEARLGDLEGRIESLAAFLR